MDRRGIRAPSGRSARSRRGVEPSTYVFEALHVSRLTLSELSRPRLGRSAALLVNGGKDSKNNEDRTDPESSQKAFPEHEVPAQRDQYICQGSERYKLRQV